MNAPKYETLQIAARAVIGKSAHYHRAVNESYRSWCEQNTQTLTFSDRSEMWPL